jgi:hypothetical protein
VASITDFVLARSVPFFGDTSLQQAMELVFLRGHKLLLFMYQVKQSKATVKEHDKAHKACICPQVRSHEWRHFYSHSFHSPVSILSHLCPLITRFGPWPVLRMHVQSTWHKLLQNTDDESTRAASSQVERAARKLRGVVTVVRVDATSSQEATRYLQVQATICSLKICEKCHSFA